MNIAVYQQMLSAYAQSQMRSHSICGSSDFLELFLLIKNTSAGDKCSCFKSQ